MNEASPPPPRGLLNRFRNACLTILGKRPVGRVQADCAEPPEALENESRRRGFELVDASTVRIALLCFGLVIFVALSMLGVTIIYDQQFKTQTNAFGAGYQGGASARTPIEETWQALDGETSAHLGGYRWIDKQRGEVQIPIDRAMELVREKPEVQP